MSQALHQMATTTEWPMTGGITKTELDKTLKRLKLEVFRDAGSRESHEAWGSLEYIVAELYARLAIAEEATDIRRHQLAEAESERDRYRAASKQMEKFLSDAAAAEAAGSKGPWDFALVLREFRAALEGGDDGNDDSE